MSCPICKRVLCDHTPAERGQTQEEMLKDMQGDWKNNPNPTNADKQIQKDTKELVRLMDFLGF